MNEKLTMTLKWLSYVALFFCAVWFVFLCYQSYHQVFDTTGSHIHWEAKQIIYSTDVGCHRPMCGFLYQPHQRNSV